MNEQLGASKGPNTEQGTTGPLSFTGYEVPGGVVFVNVSSDLIELLSLDELRLLDPKYLFSLIDRKFFEGLNATNLLPKQIDVKFVNVQTFWLRIFLRKSGDKSFSGTVCDITDLKTQVTDEDHLKNQLQQRQKMESLGSLSGGIAHEFNNILQGVQNSFSMLEENESYSPELDGEYIAYGKKFCERGRDLVEKILQYCRKDDVDYHPVNLPSCLEEIVTMLKLTLPKSVRLHERIRVGKGFVLSDPTQLQQVVVNLVVNASHALELSSDKTIVLELLECYDLRNKYPDGHYLLKIHDYGKGMSREVMSQIFEPFYTTKIKGQGTGMGLAIVKGIVDEHNGHIEVDSELGIGTTFKVFLPIYFGELDFPIEVSNIDSTDTKKKSHILIVDDEQMLTAMSTDMLKKAGYDVSFFADPRSALEEASTNGQSYDLVITDYSMPGLNGIEFVEKMKEQGVTCPVILSSGFKHDNSGANLIDLHLNKPFSKKELLHAVESFCNQ